MRRHVLLMLCVTACSSGAGRDDGDPSASIGETTGGGMTGQATNWTSGDATDGESGDATGTSGDPSTTVSSTMTADDTSSDGTTSSAATCAEDPNACDAWFLPRGASAWDAVEIGGPAALAPTSSVLAAFDIEEQRIAFVLTATEVIRVDLEQRAWVSKTALADRFPEVDVPIGSAWSIPAYWDDTGGGEAVAIIGTDVAFIYAYDAATDMFDFGEATGFGAEWNTPNAPDPAAVRDAWIDLTNADGWAEGSISDVCDGDGPIGPHIAIVADSSVHIDEAGVCFQFFDPVAYEEFAPFGMPGAPAADRLGGAVYNETVGLVVFSGE